MGKKRSEKPDAKTEKNSDLYVCEMADLLAMKINPEFSSLLPKLSADEKKQLEDSLRQHGCLTPFVTGRDKTVYDGSNRRDFFLDNPALLKNRAVPVMVRVVDLGDDNAVKTWILENQLGRRNLTEYQRTAIALKHKTIIAEQAKANQKAGGGAVRQKSVKPVNTQKEVAKIAGVSRDTVAKVEYIEKHADEETKEALRKKTPGVSINATHKKLKEEAEEKSVGKPKKSLASKKNDPAIATGKKTTAESAPMSLSSEFFPEFKSKVDSFDGSDIERYLLFKKIVRYLISNWLSKEEPRQKHLKWIQCVIRMHDLASDVETKDAASPSH